MYGLADLGIGRRLGVSIPGPCASSDERDMQDTSLEEPR
jgi:hypothetical protein